MATHGPRDPDARRIPRARKRTSEPDVSPIDVGDETGDASSPRPDENVVDEIGREAGMTFQDNEPLRPIEKVGDRDRERWELDPASSVDFAERQRDPESVGDHEGEALEIDEGDEDEIEEDDDDLEEFDDDDLIDESDDELEDVDEDEDDEDSEE